MIIALVLSYLFLGSGSSMLALQGHSPADFENAVKHVVTDGNRKKDALRELDSWKKSLKVQDEAADKDDKTLLKLMKRHDTTRAEIDQLNAKLDETFREMDRNFLDTRSKLRDHLTKEEWGGVATRLNKR